MCTDMHNIGITKTFLAPVTTVTLERKQEEEEEGGHIRLD